MFRMPIRMDKKEEAAVVQPLATVPLVSQLSERPPKSVAQIGAVRSYAKVDEVVTMGR